MLFGVCEAVSSRYREYRRKMREERRRKILEEVREVTINMHASGVYPSQERVRLLLAKPGSIKEFGALAVWHETLRELGLENKGP
jgi:2'-5' RNA ligase